MNTSKYAGKTIIEIAQERGSAAKTQAGAWKYLLADLHRIETIGKIMTSGRRNARRRNARPGSCRYDWERYRQARMERRADGRALILGYSLTDPTTPGRILAEAWTMNGEWNDRCRIAIDRDNYGMIYRNANAAPAQRPRPEVAGWDAAWDLVHQSAKNGTIPNQYDSIDFDRKGRAEGDALHHELYDFAPRAAIVCVRRTEGTRYGVKTLSKTYMLIESCRRNITAREITIPVAKYAKMPILHYGDIVAIAQGRKKITLLSSIHQVRHGYKAVRVNDDGSLESVWDGSPWELGKTRIEAARDGHNSGLYYYQDLRAMLAAVRENEIFGEDKPHNHLAILEVEATGAHIQYGAKFAATRITPIRQVASTI